MNQQSSAPVGQIKNDRSLLKYILLSIVTLGIYALVFYAGVSSDINIIASRHDGKKTMNGALMMVVSVFTMMIVYLIWFHRVSDRIGDECRRRGINTDFNSGTFWLWGFVGSIFIVGPWIYTYKLCETMNQLATHYNQNG